MSYLEITDARVEAYAPVTARLMRDYRDDENAVRVSLFSGCYPAPGYAEQAVSLGGGAPWDFVAWNTLPGSTFRLQLLPGQHGNRTHLQTRVSLRFLNSSGGTNTGQSAVRLTDGTIHGPEIAVVENAGGVGVLNPHRLDWAGAVATFGLKSWFFQIRANSIGTGALPTFRLVFDGSTTGQILRGGSTDAAIAALE